MSFLFLRAYLSLIQFGLYFERGNFEGLYRKVRSCPVAPELDSLKAIGNVCSAMDLACIWYWKEALCLQRSAATTCLLRSSGIDAKLVVGVRKSPFKAHAWVEVDGQVVNDKPYMQEIYDVLDRC